MARQLKIMAVFMSVLFVGACSEMPTLDCMSEKDVSDMKDC